MAKNKTIVLCVDCQKDFISGSLAVPMAKEAINKIISYIQNNKDEVTAVSFTVDWHPSDHCSFNTHGGQWPLHCVQKTIGASIDHDLWSFVERNNLFAHIYPKGTRADKEEYSFLQNEHNEISVQHLSKYDHIVVCGIASEYCVLNTLVDLVKYDKLKPKISVLIDGVAAIESHDQLMSFARKMNVSVVNV